MLTLLRSALRRAAMSILILAGTYAVSVTAGVLMVNAGSPFALACRVETGKALVEAGLHPATGGDGSAACSGEMLLEALAACAGVTLRAVATAIGVALRGGTVTAEGDLDFRGTLGVSKEVPVGLEAIRLGFDLDTDANAEKLDTLLRLTSRYCVVYQTLISSPSISVTCQRAD